MYVVVVILNKSMARVRNSRPTILPPGLMFGGLDDGAEIIPEPLLDEHIACDVEEKSGVLEFHFAVKPPKKQIQWRVADTKEYDALALALAEMGKEVEAAKHEVLEKAIAESKDAAGKPGERRRKKPRRKRKKKQQGAASGRPHKNNKEVTKFMKAAKFVRGMGASKIHPSAKLVLFGMRMQAIHGDAADEDSGDAAIAALTNLRGLKGSALALQRLKIDAWRSQKSKKREEAMREYVDLVTSLAPQWRVAAVLAGHESVKDDKPRPMVWTVKVKCREIGDKEVEKILVSRGMTNERVAAGTSSPAGVMSRSESAASLARFRVSSVEILQSSDGGSARLWSEECTLAKKKGKRESEIQQK